MPAQRREKVAQRQALAAGCNQHGGRAAEHIAVPGEAGRREQVARLRGGAVLDVPVQARADRAPEPRSEDEHARGVGSGGAASES